MSNFKVKNGIDAGGAINKVTITVPATGSTFTLADGKTLTVNNTLTFSGTDSSTLNIGAGGTLGSAAYTATSAYLASGVTSLPSVTSVNGTTIPSSATLLTSTSTVSALTTVGTITSGTWNGSTIAIANGGTGATTQAGAANAILPSQASANGLYLKSDGTNVSWASVPAGYSAPTIGSTSIASGSTVTTIAGLTLTTPTIDVINAASASGTTASLFPNTTTGTVAVASGLTTGTVNIATGGSSTNAINMGNSNTTVTINGSLDVKGTVTTIESTTVTVADKNLELAKVATPTDTTADGGGITIKGATDKTFNYVNATPAFTSSENMDLASGKAYKIAGTTVLSGSALGTGITGSSLTSVGTIGTGTWQGSVVGAAYGGTGVANAVGSTITLAGPLTTVGAYTLGITTTGNTTVTLPTSGTLVNSTVTSLSSLATVGTITSGTWNGSVIGGTYGGTGVNNGSSTITLGGSLTTVGAYTTSLTATANTAVTLPTSGTLATTTGASNVLGASATASTISANTATTVDTIAMSAFTTAKYIVSIKQGTKIRSSEVLVQSNGTSTVDFSEYSIVESGGSIAGVSVDAANSSTNCILTVTITDAATTNATVKFNKVVM
jgi:hypothetical protein